MLEKKFLYSSLIEQVITSAFTFMVLVGVVRILDGPELAVFSSIWGINQSFMFFIFGMVLQPISSASGVDTPKQLGYSLIFLAVILVGYLLISPIAFYGFSALSNLINIKLWLLAFLFFSSQSLFECLRWLSIRNTGSSSIVAMTMTRFTVFLILLIVLTGKDISAIMFITSLFAINAMSILFMLFSLYKASILITFTKFDRGVLRNVTNLGIAAGNFLNYVTTILVVETGLGGYGLAAFQAIRSITNPIGLISQIIDNHITARYASLKKNIVVNINIKIIFLVVATSLMIISIAYGKLITVTILGSEFASFWKYFPILLLSSFVHLLSRPYIANWRVSSDISAMKQYSFILIAITPLLIVLGLLGYVWLTVLAFALAPLFVIVVHHKGVS